MFLSLVSIYLTASLECLFACHLKERNTVCTWKAEDGGTHWSHPGKFISTIDLSPEEWWVEAVPVLVITGWSWPWMMSVNQGLARDWAKHLTRQHRWCNEKVVVHSLHKREHAEAWRRTTHTEVIWHSFLFKMSLCNQKSKFCLYICFYAL